MAKALYSKPLGFRDNPTAPPVEVKVVGYVWGYHDDMAGYRISGTGALAICIMEGGTYFDIPLRWLRTPEQK